MKLRKFGQTLVYKFDQSLGSSPFCYLWGVKLNHIFAKIKKQTKVYIDSFVFMNFFMKFTIQKRSYLYKLRSALLFPLQPKTLYFTKVCTKV